MSTDLNIQNPIPQYTEKTDEITAKLEQFLAEQNPPSHLNPSQKENIACLFGNSPFLSAIAQRNIEFTAQLFANGPDFTIDIIWKELSKPYVKNSGVADLMENLRILKAKVALTCAYADVVKEWPLHKTTKALSDFASQSLNTALAFLLTREAQKGNIELDIGDSETVNINIVRYCGFFILGMGKLGANELNYSSDIDLIALYDPSKVNYTGRKSIKHFFVSITQELMQIMERRTMHGYVFRTDLRLRPDPGSTPVAISIEAAETYYHTVAANWERSAMIKATPIAGDKKLGQSYLDNLSSWIWRRSMDFAAIQDIAAIKHYINTHFEQSDKDFEGFDVKLGKGGIREIEFFAQINQLLYGGRHIAIRKKATLQTLDALVEEKLLESDTRDRLRDAYIYLRTLEHRIQMINDEQTHTIPEDDDQRILVCKFMGYDGDDQLKESLFYRTRYVSKTYQELMPDDQEQDKQSFIAANLEKTLNTFGYSASSSIANIISGWRSQKYRALRTDRSQKLLEECLPGLIASFAEMSDPDAALTRFDAFIAKLPAGVQLFALFQANPSLFKLIARVMGLAPALADTLAKKPMLWELLLEPYFFAPIENETELTEYLQSLIDNAQDYQDILDKTRQFAEEYKFRIGVQMLESIASTDEAMQSLALIADVILKCLIPCVEAEFQDRYGSFENAGIAILAMGKYGGSELTHTSDLDIVFLYYIDDMSKASNGQRSLGPSQYFSRLGQNIITAITALTSEGRLYEVDTRLRPSGNQGPLVVTLDTFRDYYGKSAWTWEHMALTRSRIIKEPTHFKDQLVSEIRTILTKERDQETLLKSISNMRQKLRDANKVVSPWAIKHAKGGLVDIEFICQYLLLKHGENYPQIFSSHIDTALNNLLEHQLIDPQICSDLIAARQYMQNIQSVLRLCHGEKTLDDEAFSIGLTEILCKSTKQENFDILKGNLLKWQSTIYKHFQTIIDYPNEHVENNVSD
ncbi:bifunctional [glutamine synthetase] adenylyltransferase/[glutamine synthetase]-adenylyl-L-tyrosine phosphorylase [Kordiimonas sp. SCSIO 12610]|uniref:bifunctional [glutamine synthetase] adenylyltransferase/[glutamine synthetase]-adenylyl-L-tyrosine phosphorylase n=1 Tax=Kordiimonas sp. SCSIO 12610 TaxID=2829597 RepID=UPI00210E232E|nr:bifunctional [glutamine synthetase] adenylyltransferase/[glutamine synthetase]-adenylyl-L-tyrosine phosphorylase [Kordiimonas sp. SCSIO 12610]UTW53853.1 bifunctional [glutamine synthetase] adenylyltransferase/[glutamine synthetase]-adenylyl-L-tyrosine phosphorylase [Kordiimonas sp. SCSIO 12610]